MKKRIPIGLNNYKKLKEENYYFVDKSLMIRDFIMRGNEVTLVTRPRRFGKTINMSMLAEFFDITSDSKELFKDTEIMKTEYGSYINQYPTIFISFANAKGDKRQLVSMIKEILIALYQKNQVVFKDLDMIPKVFYDRIIQNLIDFDLDDLDHIGNVLSFLMEQMEKYYGKKVMLFIDEYDTPFIEAHVGGFYQDIKGGLASMLHNALKTSTSLQYAMLTGIQRVAKENIFSDLNNLVVCTVKDPEYAKYFGFTEEETKEVLEYYHLELNEEVRTMYDGYRFGNEDIYNPWSILNYASRKSLEPYWVNTSSNKMIRKAMENNDMAFKRGYDKLIETGCLETTVSMETSFFEISSTASLWGLFVNAGYLTISRVISAMKGRYQLKVPNQEVQNEFQNITAYYLNVSDTSLADMFAAIEYQEEENFKSKYADLIMELPSYHDLKDENSYHMMMLGMCAWLSYDYEIISNKEAGKGRCDIILKAKKDDKASYIFEFKYLKEKQISQEKLEEVVKEAVQQIIDKRYDVLLTGQVTYVGLAHQSR